MILIFICFRLVQGRYNHLVKIERQASLTARVEPERMIRILYSLTSSEINHRSLETLIYRCT